MSDHTNNPYTQAFFIIPSYILDLPGLTLGYLKVYEAIFQFWNHNKTCFLSEQSLMDRTKLKRSQIYAALAYFESLNELKRVHRKHKRYIVRPEKIIETDCLDIKLASAAPDPSTIIAQTSAPPDSDVRSTGRDPSAPADHNTKKITKEINTTSTRPSSSIFSDQIKTEMLDLKLETDSRTETEYLAECEYHVMHKSDIKYPVKQRSRALIKLLRILKSNNEVFKCRSDKEIKIASHKQETDEQRQNRQFLEYERYKELNMEGYKSKYL